MRSAPLAKPAIGKNDTTGSRKNDHAPFSQKPSHMPDPFVNQAVPASSHAEQAGENDLEGSPSFGHLSLPRFDGLPRQWFEKNV